MVLAVGAEQRVRGPELVHAPEGRAVLLAPPSRRRLVELDDGLEEPRPVGGRQRRRRAPRVPHVDLKYGLASLGFDGEYVGAGLR